MEKRIVSALDISHALANELSFGTGLLPDGALWWQNTRGGPVFALYVEPGMRKLAWQDDVDKPIRRFEIPLPGFIFLCTPGLAPWVYAVAKKPTKETDQVFRAPLLNVHDNGRSCAGTHTYPTRVGEMVQSFFVSFFSNTADLKNRSKKFPESIVDLWRWLEKEKVKEFPLEDMVRHGTVRDLLMMNEGRD